MASENTTEEHDADTRVMQALPGYPFLPCPICRGVEGCDHSVPERARGMGLFPFSGATKN